MGIYDECQGNFFYDVEWFCSFCMAFGVFCMCFEWVLGCFEWFGIVDPGGLACTRMDFQCASALNFGRLT